MIAGRVPSSAAGAGDDGRVRNAVEDCCSARTSQRDSPWIGRIGKALHYHHCYCLRVHETSRAPPAAADCDALVVASARRRWDQ